MKRLLVDYHKLSHEVAALLIDTYPDGYGDEDIIAFRNAKGEIIEAVEVKTEDTLYLVKISKSLSYFISNFEDLMEKEDEEQEAVTEKEDELQLNLEEEMEDDPDFD